MNKETIHFGRFYCVAVAIFEGFTFYHSQEYFTSLKILIKKNVHGTDTAIYGAFHHRG